MNSYLPEALAAAGDIANRLADPHWVLPTRTDTATRARRNRQSLAGGAVGIALLHIERARTGHGDWTTAHAWLAMAADDELTAGHNANLYFGAPAVAFAISVAADHTGDYQKALSALDVSTTAITRRRLDAAHSRRDSGERPTLAEFDLIRGLAGLGAYHLRRHPEHDVTRDVLAALVRVTEPLPGRHDDLPPWWTETSLSGEPSPDFPGGHGNVGMSHGIAAPLALLALASIRGVCVDGQQAAIKRIRGWLDTWQQAHPSGPWWPGYITRDHARTGRVEPSCRQRPSWCYGTPGVARAVQLAAIATGDHDLQRTGEQAMLASLRDPVQLDQLTEVGLCHGTAGALQSAWRMAGDATTDEIANELAPLTTRLLAQLPNAAADPELFDGLAGIALALHTIATAEDGAPPAWDRCMLLA
ncbi:lanthionine synthetase C family protein [Haloechinothrix halophila]|uniref:lanthionine synthetase C family protein n=1 Tax=Haloechinothrix halophila TaxID=1069073 RepID=UPI0003F9C88D|nr:lanthionine synthetase C family protein [Haloechinothrix halophila]